MVSHFHVVIGYIWVCSLHGATVFSPVSYPFAFPYIPRPRVIDSCMKGEYESRLINCNQWMSDNKGVFFSPCCLNIHRFIFGCFCYCAFVRIVFDYIDSLSILYRMEFFCVALQSLWVMEFSPIKGGGISQ